MADTIDDVVEAHPPNQAAGNKQNEKNIQHKSTLESFIGEFTDAARAGINMTIALAAPIAGYALTGNAGVLATSAAYVAGTKGKKSSKTIRRESLSGAIFGTFAHYTTLPLRYFGKIGKMIYMIPWVFGANAFYMAEDHLIKEKSPKGLYKKFKENYLNVCKKAFTLPAPLNILAAMFLPQQYMVAAIGVSSFLFRRFVAGGKGEEQTDKTPYVVAASNALGRGLKNTFYAGGAILDGFVDYTRNMYKSAPKPAAPAAPATPAPAGAHL